MEWCYQSDQRHMGGQFPPRSVRQRRGVVPRRNARLAGTRFLSVAGDRTPVRSSAIWRDWDDPEHRCHAGRLCRLRTRTDGDQVRCAVSKSGTAPGREHNGNLYEQRCSRRCFDDSPTGLRSLSSSTINQCSAPDTCSKNRFSLVGSWRDLRCSKRFNGRRIIQDHSPRQSCPRDCIVSPRNHWRQVLGIGGRGHRDGRQRCSRSWVVRCSRFIRWK